MKEKKQKNVKRKEGRDSWATEDSVNTDPLGMYTGVPSNPNEMPVQDADDL